MSDNLENPYAAPNFAKPAPEQALSEDDELAERGSRFLAVLIDMFLIVPAVIAISVALEYTAPYLLHELGLLGEVLMTLLVQTVFFAIHGQLLLNSGQTVGKYFMKIQIVDQKTSELLPLARVYVYRNLWIEVVSLFLVMLSLSDSQATRVLGLFGLIDALLLFGAGRLCLHDHFAFSKVVKFRQNRPRLA